MSDNGLTEKEFTSLVEDDFRIVKSTNIVSDGKTLLVRIPKQICQEMELNKTDSIEWVCDPKTKELHIKLIKNG